MLIVWLAAHAVLDKSFTAGMLFAFVAYREQFSTRIAGLIDKATELAMLRLHGERVADIVMHEREAETPHEHDEVDLQRVPPSIELRDVSFRYPPTEPFVFENVSLKIAAGECVAITDASGGGKTTLVKVMLGLLKPSQGEILVGGTPVQRLGLTTYRQMIGTVMQSDRLFSGSLADNTCFFDPMPDMERIEACARLASIDKEILDMLNERNVNDAVKAMQLTRVLVAHRPETIAMADRVLVMERGRLVPQAAGAMS
ncbi:MAG: ATP-binding cassette domain-containing protein [Pseudomonadota bacterium]